MIRLPYWTDNLRFEREEAMLFVPSTSSSMPSVSTHQFVGVPNNGSITVAVTVPPDDVGLSLMESISSAINVTDFY
jgi:hypothetical protein